MSRGDISCKQIAVKGDLNVSELDKYVANHHSKYVIGIFRLQGGGYEYFEVGTRLPKYMCEYLTMSSRLKELGLLKYHIVYTKGLKDY